MPAVKIIAGKEYRTHSGHKARIYAVDGAGDYPIHGAIFTEDGWLTETWLEDGFYDKRQGIPGNNLVAEWTDEPQEFEVWVRGCEISMNSPFAGNTEWRKVRVRIVEE